MASSVTQNTNQALYQAFAAAEYHVCVDGQWRLIQTGCRHPQLDQALGQTNWAIVTAFNPGGQCQSDASNRRAERALQQIIKSRGWPSFDALNRDPKGVWPDEPARLIVGVGQDPVCALARQFGQAAIVCAQSSQAAQLLFLDPPAGVPGQ